MTVGSATILRLSPLPGVAQRAADPSIFPDIGGIPSIQNSLVFGAGPILGLAASLRTGRVEAPMEELRGKVITMMHAYQRMLAIDCSTELADRARYFVVLTFDDIAQSLPRRPGDSGGRWRPLLPELFSSQASDDLFWTTVEGALAKPERSGRLLELAYGCLIAGLEGRHRGTADGQGTLASLTERIFGVLDGPRSASPVNFVTRWRGRSVGLEQIGALGAMTIAAGAAVSIMLFLYGGLRLSTAAVTEPAVAALAGLMPDAPLAMDRVGPVVTRAPEAPIAKRLRSALANDIAAGRLAVEGDMQRVRIRTTVPDLFQSASERLAPGEAALIERIGRALPRSSRLVVEGHADSDRVATVDFPDNVALSLARARVVASLLGAQTSATNIAARGYGDSRPVASNATATGKALNRRVEIVIPLGEVTDGPH
jgi:type VI secretion system protein ImpK